MQVLEMAPKIPTNPLLLPPINVTAHDSLFGGLRTPIIGPTRCGTRGALRTRELWETR